MTPEGFFAAVRELGLRSSAVPNVWIDPGTGDTYIVESPYEKTPQQREEFVAILRWKLGRGPCPDFL